MSITPQFKKSQKINIFDIILIGHHRKKKEFDMIVGKSIRDTLVAQPVKNLPAMQDTWV